jgi:hypothetical protein
MHNRDSIAGQTSVLRKKAYGHRAELPKSRNPATSSSEAGQLNAHGRTNIPSLLLLLCSRAGGSPRNPVKLPSPMLE